MEQIVFGLLGALAVLALWGVVKLVPHLRHAPGSINLFWLRLGRSSKRVHAAGLPWPPMHGDQRFPNPKRGERFQHAYSWIDRGQQFDLLHRVGTDKFIKIRHRSDCVH